MTTAVLPVTDDYKDTVFQQLVSAVSKIEGITIDLASKETNCYRDALAFLVEEMTRMYSPEQSKVMLQDLVGKINEFLQEPNKSNEARWYLHNQISTLYQAKIAQKIAHRERGWEQVNEIYTMLMERNQKDYEENRPVEFGGINYTVLPSWYQERYRGITSEALNNEKPSFFSRVGHWFKKVFD